jgi:hypothetical protein
MDRPRQFSLRFLLVEMTLIAATIGAIRLVFLRPADPNDHLGVIVYLAALCTVPVLVGAVIGGFWGRFQAGAGWGAGVLVLLVALAEMLLLSVR